MGWGQKGAEGWSEGRVLTVCSTSGCKGLSDTSFDPPALSRTRMPEGPQSTRVGERCFRAEAQLQSPTGSHWGSRSDFLGPFRRRCLSPTFRGEAHC